MILPPTAQTLHFQSFNQKQLKISSAVRRNLRTPLPLCLGSVALGIALWLAALAVTRHPLIDEMRRFVRRGNKGEPQAAPVPRDYPLEMP